MTAKSETADDLLAALAWQQQIGIDETLVDDPVSAVTVTLRDISPPPPVTRSTARHISGHSASVRNCHATGTVAGAS